MNSTASSKLSVAARKSARSPRFGLRLGLLIAAAASANGCYFPPAETGRSMNGASAQIRQRDDFLPRALDAGAGTIVLEPQAGRAACPTFRLLGICIGAARNAPSPAAPATSQPPALSGLSARPWNGGI